MVSAPLVTPLLGQTLLRNDFGQVVVDVKSTAGYEETQFIVSNTGRRLTIGLRSSNATSISRTGRVKKQFLQLMLIFYLCVQIFE